MASPGQRGQFDKTKHPYAFPDSGGALAFARKSSSFEKVYNAITGVPSAASAPYAVNRCRRFTVKVFATTAITCEVQVCADPEIGDWFTIATLNLASPYYSTENLFSHVRLNVTAVTGTAYAWLLRDYKGDTN
jgi:hypothetical protein